MNKRYTKEDYINWPYVEEPARFDTNGKAATRALFIETALDNKGMARFTLREEQKGKYPSAYQIIHYANSEYDAAMKICGSLEIWDAVKGSQALKQGIRGFYIGIDQALQAQERRIESDMLLALYKAASQGNVSAMNKLEQLKSKAAKRKKSKGLEPKDNVSHLDELLSSIKDRASGED